MTGETLNRFKVDQSGDIDEHEFAVGPVHDHHDQPVDRIFVVE